MQQRWIEGSSNSVSTFYVEHNYAITTSYHPPDSHVACFKTAEEVMNHIEIHVSTSSIKVYASDAGDIKTLRLIAYEDGLSLPFTRGYVSFQHTHYNAYKPDPSGTSETGLPPHTTYHWDNIGFDGPVLPTERSYEIQDTLGPSHPFAPLPKGMQIYPGGINTGYLLSTTGMVAMPAA